MGASMQQFLVLLINTLGGVLLFAVLLRFLLQAAGADFYNPVTQSLVKITHPLLRPLRRLIPGWRGFDFAALVLALLLNTLFTGLMYFILAGGIPGIGTLVSWSFVGLLSFILNIYFYGLLVSIIASWVAPYSGHPVLILIQQLIEPVQARFRRFIPAMGGLDFSPIFIFLAIQGLEILVVRPIAGGLGLYPQVVIGI